MADPWDQPADVATAPSFDDRLAGAPAADPWDAPASAPQPQGPQGGLMQTIPQGIEMMSSAEGRAKLWEGVKKFPADFAQGMLDFVKTPGRGMEQGLTPDEQIDFAFNAALGTIGTATKFKMPRAAIEAVAPHMQEFEVGVMQPAAQQFAHDAMQQPPEMLNEIKARSGQPENAPTGITAYHGSPYSFDAFSTQHIGTGEGAQAYGHGLYFAESEGVAKSYRDALTDATVDGKKFDPYNALHVAAAQVEESGSRAAAIKEIEKAIEHDPGDPSGHFPRVLALLKSDRELPKIDIGSGSLYQVRINADPQAMLDWDKPLNQQSPDVQNAVKQAMGIDYNGNFDQAKSDGMWNDFGSADAGVAVRQGFIASDDKIVAQRLSNAGVPGIKYLDKGSRGVGGGTRNFVVFNEGDIQITHKNGEPIPTPMLDNIIQAKQAGLIGPDIPPPPDETPAASAQRAIPAASNQGDKVTMTPAGEPIDAWEKRFNNYVDKTETPDDFKALVKDMAAQSNNFPEARAGSVAPEMVQKVAEAAGLDPADLNASKLRTTFRTDDEIRTVTALLKKLGDDVDRTAADLRANNTPENMAAFQAAIIKRDYGLEGTLHHVVALRAEWGRGGNALQSIQGAVDREAAMTNLLKDKGRTPEDLMDIARGLNGLDREQAAKVLSGMRGQAPHWAYWIWTQGLISGPFTHAKYVLANATYAAMERGVVTPLASIIGKAKDIAGVGSTDKVFFGETAAAHYGTIAAVPDAIKAAYQTIRTGMKVPLESEKQLHDMAIAAGEKPSVALSRAVEPNLQPPRPIPGIWGRIIGVSGDAASSVHVAFKVLGERANLEMWAYNKAAAEGLNPAASGPPPVAPGHIRFYHGTAYKDASGFTGKTFVTPYENYARNYHGNNNNVLYTDIPKDEAIQRGLYDEINGYPQNGSIDNGAASLKPLPDASAAQTFWQRKAYHALNPSDQVLKDTVYQAYKDTFMQELGEHGKKFQKFTKEIPTLKWVFPFTHIPINLLKATYEYTPFAALDKDMRANILGENGGRQQDLAIARMTVGSVVMGYFAHKYMQGQVTSNYPTDQNERKDWALQGKPANSIQIGDRWVSFERFGPAGDLAQIGAAIASVAHRFAMDKDAPDKGSDDAMSHAIWATVNAAANTLGNEVGFQSLRNFMDAIEDEKKGGSFAAYQTTSMLPFSSLLTQTASFMDPHMRVAKSLVNGLLYRIPELREGLLAKRDPLYGTPLDNPGYHGVIRSVPINADPVKIELERVNLHPTAPRDVIGGVKLTPEQYDRYQATAGPLVERALTSLVNHPGWQQIPLADRADTLRATISAMRQQAATAMQMSDPKLVQQGLQQRLDYISGKTNTPRPKRPPELAQP